MSLYDAFVFFVKKEYNIEMEKQQPPRPGLVPKSGDPKHPYRWIRRPIGQKPKVRREEREVATKKPQRLNLTEQRRVQKGLVEDRVIETLGELREFRNYLSEDYFSSTKEHSNFDAALEEAITGLEGALAYLGGNVR